MPAPIVWLASYPRSGNTFLRTIIFHCFGLRSGSVYANDLGDYGVGDIVGHIEHGSDGRPAFADEPIRLIKTHAVHTDMRPTIYILRDGRDATTSLYDFYKRKQTLRTILEGRHLFGTWAGHLEHWKPAERPFTLLLRYEDIVRDMRSTVDRVGEFLRITPTGYRVPTREEMARADGKWVRSASTDRAKLFGEDLQRFWEINGAMMHQYGYGEKNP